ncbi:hypothetical protein BIV25_22325 [Streptomyces sp. MUSC 14]|uniref:acyl-CoA carboxylase subunit epsilon n=1 Tax=Streptomyces sp. MUSC 14 TaxID=1354889 RepID=UPI0008F5DA88|nr:acyl-CoA carboxylase subunit epsilon [Streptomyces sp. MUSC 14]OIJ94494.1 hypothetical protein BIV25_22325 [Streptomyces sp. MUSC 14]
MSGSAPLPPASPVPPIRVERGQATAEELAALTVLLLSRSAQTAPDAAPATDGGTSWRPHAYHAPHSWQRS